MQTFSQFTELPLTAISPQGWLRVYLEKQRDGLTGHLEAAGYPFNTPGWAAPVVRHGDYGSGWWPYEQTGYWYDGMIRCGYLLNDQFLIEKACRQIDYVLAHADPDGYLGPALMKDPVDNNRWAHTVFFRAWLAHYSATGDSRILPALTRHYTSGSAEHTFHRNTTNIEIMLAVYERTGDARLLRLAQAAYQGYNLGAPEDDTALETLLSDKLATEHGVTYNEMAKLPMILYMYTGEETYYRAAIKAYQKLDRDHMLVDGVPSSSERLRGKDPLDSHETCDIADYTWSVGYLLMATGKAEYGDKIERACFNAAPGAVRDDFKGAQYLSCPNQVIADRYANHNLFYRGSPAWMSYRPNPATECCPGNLNRIMPNFAARMWLHDGHGNLAAALYGPSQVTARVGATGQEVTIVEETQYPFGERIDFQVRTEKPVTFTLWLRIPGWCQGAELTVNGRPFGPPLAAGTFAPVTRNFAHNDRIVLTLPMELKLQYWPGGGVSLERGPLVYTLGIEEDWQIDAEDRRSTPAFPAWNLYPASEWNYALALDEDNLDQVEVIRLAYTPEPWRLTDAPVVLRVPARKVNGWEIVDTDSVVSESWHDGVFKEGILKGRFRLTPPLPDPKELPKMLGEDIEMIRLVPYGCAKLRVTIFPEAAPPDAHSSLISNQTGQGSLPKENVGV